MKILLLLFGTRKTDVMCYRWNRHGEVQWLFCFQQQPSWGWCSVLFEEQFWVLSVHEAPLFNKSPLGPAPRLAVCICRQVACGEEGTGSHQPVFSCIATEQLWLLSGPALFWDLRFIRALGTTLRSSLGTNVLPAKRLISPAIFCPTQRTLSPLPQNKGPQRRINLPKRHSFQHTDSNSDLPLWGSYLTFRASRDFGSQVRVEGARGPFICIGSHYRCVSLKNTRAGEEGGMSC